MGGGGVAAALFAEDGEEPAEEHCLHGLGVADDAGGEVEVVGLVADVVFAGEQEGGHVAGEALPAGQVAVEGGAFGGGLHALQQALGGGQEAVGEGGGGLFGVLLQGAVGGDRFFGLGQGLLVGGLLDEADLVVGQAVKAVDDFVDEGVGLGEALLYGAQLRQRLFVFGLDLALDGGPVGGEAAAVLVEPVFHLRPGQLRLAFLVVAEVVLDFRRTHKDVNTVIS